jgi:hypothetical protein
MTPSGRSYSQSLTDGLKCQTATTYPLVTYVHTFRIFLQLWKPLVFLGELLLQILQKRGKKKAENEGRRQKYEMLFYK